MTLFGEGERTGMEEVRTLSNPMWSSRLEVCMMLKFVGALTVLELLTDERYSSLLSWISCVFHC